MKEKYSHTHVFRGRIVEVDLFDYLVVVVPLAAERV
jgi:hypothetical protein